MRCCWRVATRSSRLQRVAGQWYVAGLRVAIDSTSRRDEGGKAPRPTRARRILQATEAVLHIATAPTANGMTVTVEFLGHLKIRRAGAPARRINWQRKAKAWGVEWARTIDSKWACSLEAKVTWGARGTGIVESL